jgi:hypothetical protein
VQEQWQAIFAELKKSDNWEEIFKEINS